MILEIPSEERLIWKVQVISYFLNASIGKFELPTDFLQSHFVNPLICRFSTELLYGCGKMFGR